MSIKTNIDQQWHGKEIKIKGNAVRNKSAFEIGLVVEGQAKALCAIKTGRLAGSITTQSQTMGTAPQGAGSQAGDIIEKPKQEGEVLVGTPVDYAPHVEFGTGPYTITVKNAKVLTDGKRFFGKSVKHPGIPAQPFLRPSLDLAKGKTLTIVKNEAKYEFKDYIK